MEKKMALKKFFHRYIQQEEQVLREIACQWDIIWVN